MHILLLVRTNGKGDVKGLSRRIHYDFICGLKDYCSQFHTYGPGENDINLSPLPYKKGRLFSKILRYYKPDIVICYSYFCCHSWLPRDFRVAQVIKICIEVDYWNMPRKVRNWYKDNHFSFLIQRGFYRNNIIRSVWLPFSASSEFSYDVPLKNRKHKIAFVGRGGDPKPRSHYYPIRRKAVAKLRQAKLLDILGVVGHREYPSSLSKYFCYLCDSGRFDSPPAKTFEIMAAGALLFTTHFNGYKRLFHKKKVIKFYDKDLIDVVSVARRVMDISINEIEDIVKSAREEINSYHLHKHRLEDLMEILTTYKKDNILVKKWEI